MTEAKYRGKCPVCRYGDLDGHACPHCQGRGWVPSDRIAKGQEYCRTKRDTHGHFLRDVWTYAPRDLH